MNERIAAFAAGSVRAVAVEVAGWLAEMSAAGLQLADANGTRLFLPRHTDLPGEITSRVNSCGWCGVTWTPDTAEPSGGHAGGGESGGPIAITIRITPARIEIQATGAASALAEALLRRVASLRPDA